MGTLLSRAFLSFVPLAFPFTSLVFTVVCLLFAHLLCLHSVRQTRSQGGHAFEHDDWHSWPQMRRRWHEA